MALEQTYYGQGYFVVAMQLAGFSPEQIRVAAEAICYPLDNDRGRFMEGNIQNSAYTIDDVS